MLSSATTAVGRRRAGGRQGSLGFLPLKSKALSSEHFNPLSEKQFEATKGGVLTKTTRQSHEAGFSLLSGSLNLLNLSFLMKLSMSEI